MSPSVAPTRRWPTSFIAVQAIILVVALGGAAYGVRHQREQTALPPLRETPLSVRPLYNDPNLVSDEDLKLVLTKLLPKAGKRMKKVNHVDHALRFWGDGAQFKQPGVLSSGEMRQILVDHRRFALLFGETEKPLLLDQPHGVGVRTQEGPATASHVDHTLACLAEVGTPLDTPLFVWRQPAGNILNRTRIVRLAFPPPAPRVEETTYRAMLEESLRDFSLNQTEYEWSALAYALYLPPNSSWVTTEGQRIDFNMLADRIMREEPSRGVCFGNHRLYTLTVLLRIDEEQKILTPETRTEVLSYLKGMTDRLEKNQHPQGYWNIDWPYSQAGNHFSDREGDRESDWILATGHALEWWAIAPEELLPPRHTLFDACHWLSTKIKEMPTEKVDEYYTFLTHAGRALALWRKKSTGPELAAIVNAATPAASAKPAASDKPGEGAPSVEAAKKPESENPVEVKPSASEKPADAKSADAPK